jgi:hypothetical protein
LVSFGVSVCAFYVIILFFEWLYHILRVEFDKTDTTDESSIVKIVGNQSDLIENKSKIDWTGQKTDFKCRLVC